MATNEESKTEPDSKGADNKAGSEPVPAEARPLEASEAGEVAFQGGAPAQLGTARYVHSAFFAAAVLTAFILAKSLAGIWNTLAEWPPAVRAVPQLMLLAEDERFNVTLTVGILTALGTLVYVVRKPEIRRWADEVATELYKVHWPEREIVTNGTIVVLVASLFATIYIGLLDRVWGFITNLVYGA